MTGEGVALGDVLTVTVVVCTFAEERWDDLRSALVALQAQTRGPEEIVVVVDHNEALYRRATGEWGGRVRVVANQQARGLSGARNEGIAAASGRLIAFLDDDAVPAPDWVEHLVSPFVDSRIIGVSGAASPRWTGRRPWWWPREFDWVVGCSYRGLPAGGSDVRNVLGATMAFRREVFDGGARFASEVGRIGSGGAGCEETELCIRLRQRLPDARIVLEPRARVSHRVPPARQRFGYFTRRCFAEGVSKAVVTGVVGSRDGLSSERSYAVRTLPRGIALESSTALRRGDLRGLVRAGVIAVGLTVTTAGYLRGGSTRWLRVHQEHGGQPGAAPAQEFRPIRLLELDIAHPEAALRPESSAEEATPYRRARVLVRSHGRPVGSTDVALEGGRLSSTAVARIRAEIGTVTEAALQDCGCSRRDAMPGGLEATVVVATHDRPAYLRRCLDSVLATRYPGLQVVVVDSAPSTASAHDLVALDYPEVRYVSEPLPGLGRAHNRALAQVRTPVVAFTDDDVLVDPDWVRSLVAAFAAGGPEVGCVTGLIWPAELETAAQEVIEVHGSFGKGFETRVFDLKSNRPDDRLFPFTAGRLGSGANMAFRTDLLRRIGGFDSLLGAGAPGRGGDDLAAFARVVLTGHSLVYEPAAVVRHHHRRDLQAVRGQALNYGVGLSAYLTALALGRPSVIVDFVRLAPRAAAHVLNGAPRSLATSELRHELLRLQLMGMAQGPWLYLRAALGSRLAGTRGGGT